MKTKLLELKTIYDRFETDTRELKQGKACNKGCSFCCESAGTIDITTLEGLQIRRAMEKMPKARRKALTRAFRKEIKSRENKQVVSCPFLMKNKACMIYEVRPFSCRRIYSAHVCTKENPPAVSRDVMQRAGKSIGELQKLDDTGYSGHLSYILLMLSVPAFYEVYMSGEFKPNEVMEFGKSHHIGINRMMGKGNLT